MSKLRLKQCYLLQDVRTTWQQKNNLIHSQNPSAQQLFPWKIACVHQQGKRNRLMLLKTLQMPNRVRTYQ